MQYEEALKVWGKSKLENYYDNVDLESVRVEMDFNEGYACCGGTDPDCYCSFAESPSANVLITGRDDRGAPLRFEISHYAFDFVTILKEIVEAGGGTINGD